MTVRLLCVCRALLVPTHVGIFRKIVFYFEGKLNDSLQMQPGRVSEIYSLADFGVI